MGQSGIEIVKIEEVSYQSNISELKKDELNSKGIDFGFNINILSHINENGKDKNIVKVNSEITLSKNKQKEKKDFVKLKIACYFNVKAVENKIQMSDSGKEINHIDNDLLFVFISTSVGTLRGMLSYKLASSPINFVLPLFDVASIIKTMNKDN